MLSQINIEEYTKFITKYNENATLFANKNYQGHMNYDVSKSHLDVFRHCLQFNQNVVAKESAPIACDIERDFIKIFTEQVGYNSNTAWGYITSGGTISNLEALWIARNKTQRKYVLASEHAHYSINKACNILGLELKPLQIDENIPPKEIAAIVCTIGTTETGVSDDIEFWLSYANKYNIFLHADAAYGGYFIFNKDSLYLSENTKKALNLMCKADSISIDPHKLGYAPYTAGCFLLKNVEDTQYINSTKKVLYLRTSEISACTVEGSRSGAVVASVYFGHTQLSYKEILENNLIGANILKQLIAGSKHFSLYDGEVDMVMVLFKPKNPPYKYIEECFSKFNNVQHDKLQLITTTINDQIYFRICVMDPSFKEYVKEFVDKLEKEYQEYIDQYEKYLAKRINDILSIAEECDTKEELEKLLRTEKQIVAYNGFEPSGRIHIAQAIITVLNSNVLTKNGCKVKLYIADWFAMLNHKMGGDLEKIKIVGKYFIEVFKACGIDEEHVEFIWASDFITQSTTYWPRVLDILTHTTLARAKKCCQIMGRKETDALDASQIIYPCMQAADIFELGVDIPQLGIDQRKCNMLARDYAHKADIEPPTVLSHHMLIGLKNPEIKMSKSIPDSAIFMEDSIEEVNRKILAAFCNDVVEKNPIFEYIKYIIIRWFGEFSFNDHIYYTADEVAVDFEKMNKKELKICVAKYINMILDPVRKHFSSHEMKALADQVASFRVTR